MKDIEIKIQETILYIQKTYNRKMDYGYLKYAIMFSEADRNKSDLDEHHIVPRCCNGRNDKENLIKVTKKHHTELHNLILKSDLNDEERNHLEYAYLKRKGKAIMKYWAAGRRFGKSKGAGHALIESLPVSDEEKKILHEKLEKIYNS